VSDSKNGDLEGITLNVYLYAVKKGKPVGPRDVMKNVGLSSPSVAYRHLQKLDDAGYLQKNEYGEYTVKLRAHIGGYSWLGSHLWPKMWLYALVFLSILIIELFVLIIHFPVETLEFKVFFLLLTLITGLALAVFVLEGYMQNRRRRGTETE
jgi:hypothetical protein